MPYCKSLKIKLFYFSGYLRKKQRISIPRLLSLHTSQSPHSATQNILSSTHLDKSSLTSVQLGEQGNFLLLPPLLTSCPSHSRVKVIFLRYTEFGGKLFSHCPACLLCMSETACVQTTLDKKSPRK